MTKKEIEQANIIKENKKTLRNIKRRKDYKKVKVNFEDDIKDYDISKKSFSGRAKNLYKRRMKEYEKQQKREERERIRAEKAAAKEAARKYKFVQTSPIRGDQAGDTFRKRIDYKLYKKLNELQDLANARAQAAGLNYHYNFNFTNEEGAKKYLSLLENMTSDEEYFSNVAMKRDAQFVENMKSSYSAISSMLEDEDDIKLVESTLKKLSKIRTPEQARKIYLKLRERYDASELSVYIFSSNAPGELQEADINALKLINDILKEL